MPRQREDTSRCEKAVTENAKRSHPRHGVDHVAPITRPMLAWFLYMIDRVGEDGLDRTVLDCGAGGSTPPLAHFAERGYECHGIDISEEQVQRAAAYAEERGYDLALRVGDMRDLPYEDASFSYVYELESMCHLTKADTGKAIAEMTRVLKPGGLLFAHFMSTDFWPLTGSEGAPGEFAGLECGEPVIHSYFEDDEVASYFEAHDVVWKEKRFTYLPLRTRTTTLERWKAWYDPKSTRFPTEADWLAAYEERERYCYAAWEVIAQRT